MFIFYVLICQKKNKGSKTSYDSFNRLKGLIMFERIDQVYGNNLLSLWKGLIKCMERIDYVYGKD